MVELCIRDAGGELAYDDTDAAMVVSTEDGSLGLSWDAVEQIRSRFEAISPYSVGDFLELEKENYRLGPDGKVTDQREQLYVYAVASKVYCLHNWNGDEPIIRRPSKNGQFAYYGVSRELVDGNWSYLVAVAAEKPATVPEWIDDAALRVVPFHGPGQALWGQCRPFESVLVQDRGMWGRPMTWADVLAGINTRQESSMDGARNRHYRGKLTRRVVQYQDRPRRIGKEGTEVKVKEYKTCADCGERIDHLRVDAVRCTKHAKSAENRRGYLRRKERMQCA